MEILGIGTDIIECPRIGKMIEQHGELFLRRIYTEREIRYCQARKHAIEHFAGRWAAKEAILKAMGTGRSHGIAWTNIEVRNNQDGRPQVMVCGAAREIARERGIGEILVSISHCRTYATAYALALLRPPAPPKTSALVHPPWPDRMGQCRLRLAGAIGYHGLHEEVGYPFGPEETRPCSMPSPLSRSVPFVSCPIARMTMNGRSRKTFRSNSIPSSVSGPPIWGRSSNSSAYR